MAIGIGIGLSPSFGGGSSTPPVPVTGDPIGLTILNASAVSTTPTNNIDGNGYIAAVTFKGMATGLSLTPSKISVTFADAGFDATGAATTTSRTATGVAAMRMPVPAQWVTGTPGIVIGARCVNRQGSTTRIYRAASNGTTGPTPPTHTSGTVSDGSVDWTYLSDCEAATTNTATQPIEAVSGSDAVIYVVLDKRIPSTATGLSVNIQSGAYGSSNASHPANCPITNNSTFAGFKPVVSWVTPPWQLVRSGGSIKAEVAVAHPLGRSSRMAAAVKFTVYDNSNNATSVTETVTAMTQSTILTTTYGNPTAVFAAEFTQAELAAGSLADGMYSIRAEVFPFVGPKWDSDVDGFGSSSSWSISTVMRGNTAARIPFELDSDNSIPIYYACVDGVGAAPAVSTVEATAKTTPYATIVAAANALQAATGTTLAHQIIDILGGVSVTGFAATMDSGASKTYGTGWLTIRKYPGDVGVATINADTVTSANRICGRRTKFSDVEIVTAGTAAVIQNAEPATTGAVTHELWLDNCRITGTGTQQPITSMGWMMITNSSLDRTVNMIGNTRSSWHFLGGSTMTANNVSGQAICGAVHALGNKFQAAATLVDPTSRYWTENSQAVAQTFYGFNTWYNCQANVVWRVRCAGSSDGGTTAATLPITSAGAWVSNLIEADQVATKGGEISADTTETALPMLYNLYNTSAGDGQNVAYNEINSTQYKKNVVSVFNLFPDRNIKRDTWDDSTGATQPARTGSYPNAFGVDWLCNVVPVATSATPSASNLVGEYFEARSHITTGGTMGFTNDQSKAGGGAGNGDYRPTSTSVARDRIGATEQMLPIDLNGTTRRTDATGAVGAFEWA